MRSARPAASGVLPGVEALRNHCQGLALLDAVLSPEWDARFYSYDVHWGEGEQMASMRDGIGGECAIVFSAAGAYVRGLDHESLMSPWARMDVPAVWPGVVDDVPEVFRPYVQEPAFCDERAVAAITRCLWRRTPDTLWQTGTIVFPEEGDGAPDGADVLFELLVDRSPDAYAKWASEYYEVPVHVEAVRHILAGHPLTAEIVAVLNPDIELSGVAEDIALIGHPA
ncbi:hypothetical protein [Streptomyces sp. NPDC005209]|uniref:hypothetical protein n=1 Tax=Streptomyces sp. NPDC005209 TaxID=3156715 RepID=UPI0033B4E62E